MSVLHSKGYSFRLQLCYSPFSLLHLILLIVVYFIFFRALISSSINYRVLGISHKCRSWVFIGFSDILFVLLAIGLLCWFSSYLLFRFSGFCSGFDLYIICGIWCILIAEELRSYFLSVTADRLGERKIILLVVSIDLLHIREFCFSCYCFLVPGRELILGRLIKLKALLKILSEDTKQLITQRTELLVKRNKKKHRFVPCDPGLE